MYIYNVCIYILYILYIYYIYVYIYYIYMCISQNINQMLGLNLTPDPTMVEDIVVLFVGDIFKK